MKDRLRRVDLNLLVVFQALMDERSVSRAAERLFVTQPAMSKSLRRLREQFGDELFTRSSKGLIPTPEAERLYPAVNKALVEMEQVVFEPVFDPALIEDECRIAILESASSWFVPLLVARFQALAPGLSLITSNTEPKSLDQLASGKLDFAIHPGSDFGNEYELTDLTRFKPAFWMSNSHPVVKKRTLKKSDIEKFPLVMLESADIEKKMFMEPRKFLERVGISNEPILETTMLNAAIEVVYDSDAILIAPTQMGQSAMIRDHFVARSVSDFKEFDRYSVELSLIQHARTSGSNLHSWVKEQITEVVSSA